MQVNPETGGAVVLHTREELVRAQEKHPDHPIFVTGEVMEIKGCLFKIVQICRDRRIILKPLRMSRNTYDSSELGLE